LLASICAIGFVALAILVAVHATDHIDVAVRDLFRPRDVWGLAQRRSDRVVEDARPRNLAALLALVAVGVSWRRRSWRPLAYVALIGVAAALLAQAVKVLLARPDPHYENFPHSGSFPSGHTVTVIVSFGGALLLLHARTHWWEWVLVGLGGLAMGLALLVEAAHWFTDVVGGALLAITVLAAMAASPLRKPSQPPR
jgi:membrane-associated phospholipid phosphatase